MFAVPDLTVPESGAPRRPLPPATIVRAVAADPGSWRHLLRYEPDAPSRVDLPVEHPGLRLWLRGWLPGQWARLSHSEEMFSVASGVITEVDPVGERTVRAGQTRVLGPSPRRRLMNTGDWPVVTVHAAAVIARRVHPARYTGGVSEIFDSKVDQG
jgi:hypothetical protein